MKELKHILKYYLQNENHEFLKVQYSVEFTIWIQWKNCDNMQSNDFCISQVFLYVFWRYVYVYVSNVWLDINIEHLHR